MKQPPKRDSFDVLDWDPESEQPVDHNNVEYVLASVYDKLVSAVEQFFADAGSALDNANDSHFTAACRRLEDALAESKEIQ